MNYNQSLKPDGLRALGKIMHHIEKSIFVDDTQFVLYNWTQFAGCLT